MSFTRLVHQAWRVAISMQAKRVALHRQVAPLLSLPMVVLEVRKAFLQRSIHEHEMTHDREADLTIAATALQPIRAAVKAASP
jgi:hypothetical protein